MDTFSTWFRDEIGAALAEADDPATPAIAHQAVAEALQAAILRR